MCSMYVQNIQQVALLSMVVAALNGGGSSGGATLTPHRADLGLRTSGCGAKEMAAGEAELGCVSHDTG